MITLAAGNNELNVDLVSLAPPAGVVWEFSDIRCELTVEFPGGWWQVGYWVKITNASDQQSTKTLKLMERSFVPIEQGGFWGPWAMTQTSTVVLGPGETQQYGTMLTTLYAGGGFLVGAKVVDQDGYESEPCQAP